MDGTALWENRIHLSRTEILPLPKAGVRLCFEGYRSEERRVGKEC